MKEIIAKPGDNNLPGEEKLPAWDDFNFEMKFGKGEVSDEELRKKVKEMMDELWSGCLSPESRYEYYDDVQFLYQGFDHYKNDLIKGLDFSNEDKAPETVKTVFFLQDLLYHSRMEWMTADEFNQHTAEIKDILSEAVREKQGSYFLNLLAKSLLSRIESRMNFFEEMETEHDIFVDKLKEKYGDEWEDHAENELEIESKMDQQSFFEDLEARPFLIAPRVYAYRGEKGLFISEEKDYEKISALLEDINLAAKLGSGNMGEPDYRSAEEQVENEVSGGGMNNDKAYSRLYVSFDRLPGLINKPIDLGDLVVPGAVPSGSERDYARKNLADFQFFQEDFFQEIIRKDLGVNMPDLTLPEQFHLLSLIKNIKENEVGPMRKFVHLYGLKALRPFLDMEGSTGKSDKIFNALSAPENEEDMRWMIAVLNCIFTAEEIRAEIDKLSLDQERGQNQNLAYARSLISPCADKEAIIDLQKFYQENIKFEEYKINQEINGQELFLLKNMIKPKEKTLEMGCGTGRLISGLAADGYDIVGFDFTARHVELTKESLVKAGLPAKVFRGDWHNNALKDDSFDAIYSLGRNILHDYSIAGQIQLFREAERLIRPGGRFIIDIPDRGKGAYKKLVDSYAQEMQKRGIRNYRYGAIYDSPDGKHFATRYAYSHEDMQELADLAGFEIEKVEKQELKTGEGDENLYYILKKKGN